MAREEVAKNTRRTDGCLRFETMLQELVLDVLPRRKRSSLAAHLRECAACRDYLRQARRMPAVLASVPAPEPPSDLAEQIRGACLVALLTSQRQAPSMVWARMSYAGAAAAALLMFVALSYLPIAMRSAHHELAAIAFKEPLIIVPAPSEKPDRVSPVARPGAPSPVVVVRPAVAPAPQRWYAASARPLARRPAVALPHVRQAALPRPAASPREARTATMRGAVDTPPSTRKAAAAPAASAETPIDGVNNRVAHSVAAGVLAGALIEHYLADAIARRGTDLAAAGLTASSASTDAPVSRVPSDATPAAM